MALIPLTKKTYVARTTPTSSSNLNDIQDAVIELQDKALITDSQSLTTAKKTQVLTNIGAVGVISQSLTSAQKTQALKNLGAYKAGDSVSLSPNTLQFAGVAQNTSTIRFTIPLTKPIVASNASISGSVGVRCNGSWSDSFDVATATQTCTVSPCGLVVVLSFSSARSYLTQNHAAIVQPSNLSITFS